MFRVKICGITNVDDARLAADAGADAIGLNFYSKSHRVCSLEAAREVVAALPHSVCKVGVFVNATSRQVRELTETLGLDLVQLHGDETPEMLRELRGLAVMRALRVADNFEAVREYLAACHRLACMPRMLLVDACQPGAYGGTGRRADWAALASSRFEFAGQPLVLAGGLTPANVEAAIESVRPWAVDVASGVEERPGRKSGELVRAFVAKARAAFSRVAAAR